MKRYSGSKSQESDFFFPLEERNSLGHVDLAGLRTTDLEQIINPQSCVRHHQTQPLIFQMGE